MPAAHAIFTFGACCGGGTGKPSPRRYAKKGQKTMTLMEMSAEYAESAKLIHNRILKLRAEAQKQTDLIAVRKLHRRINALTSLLQECAADSKFLARYYDKNKC